MATQYDAARETTRVRTTAQERSTTPSSTPPSNVVHPNVPRRESDAFVPSAQNAAPIAPADARAPADPWLVQMPDGAMLDMREPAPPGVYFVVTSLEENQFDAVDAPDKRDEEFAAPNQTEEDVERHVQASARFLKQFNGGVGPHIVGGTEFENRAMAERVSHAAGIPNVVHFETPDERGIDQVVLTHLPIVEQRYHPLATAGGEPLRGVVQADLAVGSHITTVLVGHFPSKRNGAEGEANRGRVGSTVRELKNQLRHEDAGRCFVLLGDLNDDVGEGGRGAGGLALALTPEASLASGELYDAMAGIPLEQRGTHFFPPENSWSALDGHAFSPNTLDFFTAARADDTGLALVPGSTRVMRLPELLKADGTPLRFFGRNNQPFENGRGRGDHLPVASVLVDLNVYGQQGA